MPNFVDVTYSQTGDSLRQPATNNPPILLAFLSLIKPSQSLRSTRMCKCRSKQDAGCDRSWLCAS